MKNTMKKLMLLGLVLLTASAFASGQKGDAGVERHGGVFRSMGNPYVEKEISGWEDGIREQGFTAIARAPETPTVEVQIQLVEQLIAQRVTSIAIAANDLDALQPVLTKAMGQGIKVYSLDAAVNPQSRLTHVNQADSEKIGITLVEAAYDMCGGSGEFAILSATSQASNQNLWIDYMKKELEKSKYSNLKLIKIAYGDDLRDKSVSETEGLLLSYPNLKCIVSPTTVGIAAASKVISDRGLQGKIFVTGLGLPSEMAEYIDNGACPYMYLWNPIDVGYLSAYVATALSSGKITGKAGEQFSAGRLGNYTLVAAPDGGSEVLLGPPYKFDKANISEWKTVY
jgi:rhamnose transport system substrate-binding protein